MAAAWAMDRCRYFLLGMPGFTLAVDHHPLLKILGDAELADIHNPRIRKQKERTLMYRFTPAFIPGKQHVVPECLSRRSDSPISDITSTVEAGYATCLAPPAWVAQPPIGASPDCVAALLGEHVPPTHSVYSGPSLVANLACSDWSLAVNDLEAQLMGDAIASLAGLTEELTQTAQVGANAPQVLTYTNMGLNKYSQ